MNYSTLFILLRAPAVRCASANCLVTELATASAAASSMFDFCSKTQVVSAVKCAASAALRQVEQMRCKLLFSFVF